MPGLIAHACIGLIALWHAKSLFGARAMIDEGLNGQPLGEFRHSPNVIAMIVRDQQVIDLADARVFRRGGNTSRVPFPRKTGITRCSAPPLLEVNEAPESARGSRGDSCRKLLSALCILFAHRAEKL